MCSIERRRVRKRFYLETRADVLLRNKDVFARWRQLGLECMFFGFEAIDWDEQRFAVIREWALAVPEIVNVSVNTPYPGTETFAATAPSSPITRGRSGTRWTCRRPSGRCPSRRRLYVLQPGGRSALRPPMIEPARMRTRWTPQWGLESQAAVARNIVEIAPSRMRAASDDGES